jgi:hypothetical protein
VCGGERERKRQSGGEREEGVREEKEGREGEEREKRMFIAVFILNYQILESTKMSFCT